MPLPVLQGSDGFFKGGRSVAPAASRRNDGRAEQGAAAPARFVLSH